jgi:sugar/nucleoside kinase (ribokinase family)
MKLLIVGSVGMDSIRTPFGSVRDALGGSAVYASVAASRFSMPAIVGVVGEDFPQRHVRMLERRGIDVSGLQRVPGKTFRWKGRYLFDLNTAHTLATHLNVLRDFNPQLSEPHRGIKDVFLANIDPELQYAVYRQLRAPSIVCADTMNYWITGKRAALKKLLKVVDVLLINEGEARQLAGVPNVVRAARLIRKLGPRVVVVKRGEYGALCFSDGDVFAAPTYPLESVFDPTGAGDSFAGGFCGYIARCGRITPGIIRQAIVFGAVMGSFCVERFSIQRTAAVTWRDICRRYGELHRLVRFEHIHEGRV